MTFADHWQWDIAMYLRSLEMQVFDGRTNTVLATSVWYEKGLHAYRDSAQAAKDLVEATFKKLGIPTVEPAK